MGKYISKYLFFGSSTEQQSSEEDTTKKKKAKKEALRRNKFFNGSKAEELLSDYKEDEVSQEEEEEDLKIPKYYIGKDRVMEVDKNYSSINNNKTVNTIESIETSTLVWDGEITIANLMTSEKNYKDIILPLTGKLKMSIYAFSSKSEEDWNKYSWPEQLQIVEILERNQLKPFHEELNEIKPKFGIELECSRSGVNFFEQSRRWSRGYILRANNNINQEVMLLFEYNYYPTMILLPPT